MMRSIILSCGRMRRLEQISSLIPNSGNRSTMLCWFNSCPLDDEKYQPLLWEDENAGTDPIPTLKLREQEHNALLV
jgi:hypothetical protein